MTDQNTSKAEFYAERGPESVGFGSCAQARLLRGVWNLPGPGIEPESAALVNGFLTTGPPGKSTGRF